MKLKDDILWANSSDGTMQIWFMDDQKIAGRATVVDERGNSVVIGPPWSIVGTGDFNANGKADILWANSSDGSMQIWFMDDQKIAGRATVVDERGNSVVIGPPWRIVGTGNFNDDGKADILWANSSDGMMQIWFMDGQQIAGRANVLRENGSEERIGPPWSIVGIGGGGYVVYGAIGAKYIQLGGLGSWLGAPTSYEGPFTEGGRFSTFQHGAIYWWPDTGAIALSDVVVRYKGLYCFGETGEPSAHDEPFVIFGLVPVPPAVASEVMTQVYTDVDRREARPDSLELYRGSPLGMALGVALWEHDYSDRNKFLQQIKEGVSLAGQGVATACGAIPVVGAAAAPACAALWGELGPLIVKFVNNIAGTEDDLIEKWVWEISAKEMITKVGAPLQDWWGVKYHLESKLLSDNEASYRVYLDVEAV